MNLYFRLVLTIIRALLSEKVRCDENSVSKWRVLPNDIDAYGHMNNGRYLTLLGLAAIDAVIRTGLFEILSEEGLSLHLGSVSGAVAKTSQIV